MSCESRRSHQTSTQTQYISYPLFCRPHLYTANDPSSESLTKRCRLLRKGGGKEKKKGNSDETFPGESAILVFGYHFDIVKKRILSQDEIDRYMNNLDELSELSEDGLEYSDDVDFLPDCVSSNEDSDSDCQNSIGSQNTIFTIKIQ
ncbi:hypothetical protein TNIN_254381 [Trichonephila inaurata madagascariensis]|uniref:Uncharacterized protein n=1 Tax=Trichonephila inaurata madagascariensis TaxID=2747483 RepID=A0A8X6WV29_9ARAC|nr:hypothetical protein TNIN_254381 [Trichonephila inaurata madagascariensis]